jgi:AmmeMemoRadiSam system protein A
MPTLTKEDKHYLLQLARHVISNRLSKKTSLPLPEKKVPAFEEKNGCFVTLHLNSQLRGCIGIIEPVKPLIIGIKEYAIHAAFDDPRFSPVSQDELGNISIEISLLTRPMPLTFRDAEDLTSQLKPGVHGVILSKGYHRATFLPQVWEQLPDPKDFLTHLCRKAGMDKSCWKDAQTVVEVYEVEYFSETD